MAERSWKDNAEAKRDSISELIPQEWRLTSPIPSAQEQRDVTSKYISQHLSALEVKITESDVVNLVKAMSSGEWKAEDVTKAFCHRAALAHQLTNCLHEIFFDSAIADAKELDEYLATNKVPKGPLHGLPVSLKDQFHVRGVETTMGYVGWMGTFEGKKGTGKEKKFESEMVQELRDSGAILYCKTSVPHTLMSGETVNNIIGYTWNPKNRNLTSGGSSGGEGALIGLRGSPLGFGTDIGGSIRIPAAFNGLYGIRPSSGRMPYQGMANSMDGQNTVLSVVGPLSQSVSGLRLAIKALLARQPWLHDPLVIELPWRDEQENQILDIIKAQTVGKGKLCFGVLKNDGVVTPQPPVQRAINTVIAVLEKLGHQVIEWSPPAHSRGNDILFTTWGYDGGADIFNAFELSGEPMSTQAQRSFGTRRAEQADATKIAATNVAKREYQKEYMEYWNNTTDQTNTGRPVDALIAPLAPFPAARPETYSYYGYSTFVNLLDYTSCVIPVTLANKAIDKYDLQYKPTSSLDKQIHETYDADVFDGAHVSVQIVGRRLQEERILALAEYIGDSLGNWQKSTERL